jgi:type IV fimbrial biogenesis protein FimT
MHAIQATIHTRQRGLTLVELCATCAVVAVLVGTALPSYQSLITRKALEGRSTELATDLQLARTEAVSRNVGVRVSFRSDPSGSCYTVHTGPANACSCTGDAPATCAAGATAVKSVHLPASGPVRLQANVGSMMFDPVRGTVTPTATIRLVDRQNRAIHHVVNVMGRARTCSPGAQVPGVRSC